MKKNYPNKKFISVQNGLKNKLFFNNLRKEKNLSSDYIFTFNSSFANLYKKFIRTKTKVIGSLKNNSIKIKQKSSRKVLFVSSGFPRLKEDFNLYKKVRFKKEDYFNQDKILIRNLIKFCAKENLKLFFYQKIRIMMEIKKEIKYYKENIDSNLVNFITKNQKKVFKVVKKSIH